MYNSSPKTPLSVLPLLLHQWKIKLADILSLPWSPPDPLSNPSPPSDVPNTKLTLRFVLHKAINDLGTEIFNPYVDAYTTLSN